MKCSGCGGRVTIDRTYTDGGWRTSQGHCDTCGRKSTRVSFEAPEDLDISAYKLIKGLVKGKFRVDFKRPN